MIKKIVNIDKEAEKYKEANKTQFEDYRVAFENEIKSMMEDFEKGLKEEKIRLMEDKIKKASEEADIIKRKNEEKYNELIDSYLTIRENIVEEICEELRSAMKEG